MGQLNFFMTKAEIENQIKEIIDSDLFLVFNSQFYDSEKPVPLKNFNEIVDSK